MSKAHATLPGISLGCKDESSPPQPVLPLRYTTLHHTNHALTGHEKVFLVCVSYSPVMVYEYSYQTITSSIHPTNYTHHHRPLTADPPESQSSPENRSSAVAQSSRDSCTRCAREGRACAFGMKKIPGPKGKPLEKNGNSSARTLPSAASSSTVASPATTTSALTYHCQNGDSQP